MNTAPRRQNNPITNIGGSSGTRKFIPTFDIDSQIKDGNPSKQLNFNNIPIKNVSEFKVSKPQFVNNFKPNFGMAPKTTTSSRRPLLGMMKYGPNNNVNGINNMNMDNNLNMNLQNYNMKENTNNYNTNNYPSSQNQYYNGNNFINNPHLSKRIDNDDRPLDLGENLDKEKENINPDANEPTYPCPDCGRNFVQSALAKHAKLCKKVFQNKRKAFNPKNQRIVSEEHQQFIRNMEYQEKKEGTLNKYKKKNEIPKWKKQSEELRSMAKGGVDGGEAIFKPSVITDDYQLCKFCNRKYNDEAYKKHLPGCERRYKDAQLRGKNKNIQNKYTKYGK